MKPVIKHSYRSVTGYKARLIERVGNLSPSIRDELRSIKLDWYAIRNTTESDAPERNPEILIYEEIGGSFGVSAEEFITELNDIDAPQIDVRINSPGGSVFDAIAIYNAIVRHPANITTYVDALAASAASIIAMAGDEVVMMVGSQMMIHDAMGAEMGNAKDFREMAKFLDQQSDNLASIYVNKGGEDIKYWRNLMLAETWMMAGEAVDMKLADKVFEKPAIGDPTADPETDEEDATETPEAPDVVSNESDESTLDDSESADVEAELEALMSRPHRLYNRGYKFTGREKAPNPLTIVDGWPKKSFAELVKW